MKQISVFLCFRYLQRRKMVLLSIAAVAMSCALLIATDSLFTGFINAIEQSVGKHLGDIILETPSGLTITEYDTLIADLEQAESIHSASAVLSGQGLLLSAPGKVRPVRVWGIELPRRLNVTPLKESLLFQKDKPDDQVSFNISDDPDAIGGIVGIGALTSPDEITDQYDVEGVKELLGHRMALTTGSLVQSEDSEGEEDSGRSRFSRKVVRFNLADVVMTGVHEFDESFMLLPIEELSAKLYPDQEKSANIIHVRLADGADVDQAVAIVRGIWLNFSDNRFDWAPLVSIDSAKQMQARLIAEYNKQMKVLLFIFGLVSCGIILLVFCIFYLIVMTRRRDIGILKSCGLSSPAVAGMFMLFGTVIGLLGGICGIGLGWLIIDNINQIEHAIAVVFGIKIWKASTYMFTQIPNTMNWGAVLWITASGVIAAAAGSLIPAIAAARVKPVETLQYE